MTKKMSIENLKVSSFVTTNQQNKSVKGGLYTDRGSTPGKICCIPDPTYTTCGTAEPGCYFTELNC